MLEWGWWRTRPSFIFWSWKERKETWKLGGRKELDESAATVGIRICAVWSPAVANWNSYLEYSKSIFSPGTLGAMLPSFSQASRPSWLFCCSRFPSVKGNPTDPLGCQLAHDARVSSRGEFAARYMRVLVETSRNFKNRDRKRQRRATTQTNNGRQGALHIHGTHAQPSSLETHSRILRPVCDRTWASFFLPTGWGTLRTKGSKDRGRDLV